MNKIKGFYCGNTVNIGDKHLTVTNTEDITSYRIFVVTDVYEISPNQNAYECTRYKVKYRGKITQFKN
jgi:hypothetical protein